MVANLLPHPRPTRTQLLGVLGAEGKYRNLSEEFGVFLASKTIDTIHFLLIVIINMH